MSLEASIRVSLGEFALDAELVTEPGEVVAVLGPNGAGKSTLLRCLAGLLAVDEGRIAIDGTVVDDPAANVFVSPDRRPIGVVFQDYLLFAHLSARENVAFGLRARGVPKVHARRRADELLDRVGLGYATGAKPHELSGGQQQRVALARALAGDPRLLLLDEPLAALDVSTRAEVRRELRAHLTGFDGVRVVVTHDPLDAYALAGRVFVIENGRISQHGTLDDVTLRPRTQYVADLVGTNLLRGTSRGTTFTAGDATLTTANPIDGPAFVAIAPHAVALYRQPPDGSPRNVWQATVRDIDRRPDRARVRLAGPVSVVAEVTGEALESMQLRPGDGAWVAIKATEITAYPA